MADAQTPATVTAPRVRVPGRVLARRTGAPSDIARAVRGAVLRSFLTGSDSYPWMLGGSSALRPSAEGAMPETEELADGYLQVPRVAACTDLFALAKLLARPRLWDRDPDDDAAQEITDGPLVDLLLRKPAPWLDGSKLRMRDAQNLSLTGESFWFLHDDRGDPLAPMGDGPQSLIDLPAQITPLGGDLVGLDGADMNGPTGWRVPGGSGSTRVWPASSTLQFFEHPDTSGRRPFRGIGRLAKAYGAAAQNYLANRYLTNRLRNNGDPSGVVVGGDVMSPEELDRYRSEFDETWNSPDEAGDWKYVNDPTAKVYWGRNSPRDMEYGKAREMNDQAIAAVFGTPGPLVGEQAVNFATFAGHWLVYIQLRVRPWLILEAETINRSLIGRLKDRRLSQARIRFDLEALETLFADTDQQIARAKELNALGVPLDEVLRQAGIKTDPIPGGDVSLVTSTLVARDAAITLSRARAAGALISECQVEPADALREVGLGHLQVAAKPEPPPVVPPTHPTPPAPPEPAKALPAPAIETKDAADVDAVATKAAGRSARDAEIARAERIRRGPREKMAAGIRRVFRAMRTAQIRALEQFAAEGTVDQRVYSFGDCPAKVRKRGVSLVAPWPTPLVRGLSRDEDVRTVLLLARGVKRTAWRDCAGEEHVEPVYPEALAAKAARRGCHPQQLIDAALVTKETFSEAEIEQLLVVADAKWREALVALIEPITIELYAASAKDSAKRLGVDLINVENPSVLAALRAHTVQVVEGTTSVIAQRMRSDIIRVLAGVSPVPGPSGASPNGLATLQQAIHDSLVELKATTTSAFQDHFARALAIARTETGGAANRAQYDQFLKAHEEGVLDEVEWSTSGQPVEPDGPTRREHYDTDGQRRVPGQTFSVGGTPMLHPHDASAPARQVVNCKCALRPIVN